MTCWVADQDQQALIGWAKSRCAADAVDVGNPAALSRAVSGRQFSGFGRLVPMSIRRSPSTLEAGGELFVI